MTPAQIANWNEENGGDPELIDGYDELCPESKAKVDYALEHGHVADEDWKGVSAYYLFTTHMLMFPGCGSQPTWSEGFPREGIEGQGIQE